MYDDHVSLLQTGARKHSIQQRIEHFSEEHSQQEQFDRRSMAGVGAAAEALSRHQLHDAARNILVNGNNNDQFKNHFTTFAGHQHDWGATSLPPYSSLHDVVGKDGVLMITLENTEHPNTRVTNAVQGLLAGGIYPTPFPATNGHLSNKSELSAACKHTSEPDSAEWCPANDKIGMGCRSMVEQAVTDSHRRALIKAGDRDADWTLIIEDDVVPLFPESFSEKFAKAWEKVPEETQIVRLGWCTFEVDHGPIEYRNDTIEVDDLQLVSFMQWTDYWQDPAPKLYYAGGCTTGYMVKKQIVPEILSIFPCCCPIDCCLEWHVYYAKGHNDAPWDPRGHQVMMSMDIAGSREASEGYARFNQSGLLVQDNRGFESTRPEWNTTEEF